MHINIRVLTGVTLRASQGAWQAWTFCTSLPFPRGGGRHQAVKRSELYKNNPQKYGQLNHPKRVVLNWLEDTMPQAERKAREETRKRRAAERAAAPDPIAEDLANEEGRHRDSRHELESLRELLGLILNELQSGTVSEATMLRIRARLGGNDIG